MFALVIGLVVFAVLCCVLGWALGIGLGILSAPFAIALGFRKVRESRLGRLDAIEAEIQKAQAEGADWDELKQRVRRII